MRSVFSGYAGTASSPPVTLSSVDIDENAAPGTRVGQLRVSGRASGWSFRLADDAGGQFALSGGAVVVGAAPLSHATRPLPRILVAATDGLRSITAVLSVNVRRAWQGPPFAAGARLAAIGDGQIAINEMQGPADTATRLARGAQALAYGAIEQARALDPRFNFDTWYDPADALGRNLSGANQGVFDDHLTTPGGGGLLGRLPALLQRRPSLLILQGGAATIDRGDGSGTASPASAQECIARLDAALTLCRNEGVAVIAMTIPPRGDWPSSDARQGVRAAVNVWIRAQASRNGIVSILDPEPILAPGGILDASLFAADGATPNHRGAYRIARELLLPILQSAISPGSTFVQDPAISNLIGAAQGQMQGTAGVRIGASVTGNLATGFQLSIAGNASAVTCAKELLSGAIERQVIDIVPAASTTAPHGQVTMTLPPVTAGLPVAGAFVSATVFVETDAVVALSFARLTLQAEQAGAIAAFTVAMGGQAIDYPAPLPAGAKGLWLTTQPFQIPAEGASALRWSLDLFFPRGAAPFRIKVSKPILRLLADPRPAWGYTGRAALAISGTPGPATVGRSYAFVPTVTGGSGTRLFGLTGFLPAGLSFSATTGAITGTPSEIVAVAGLALGVSDDSGSAALVKLSLTVGAAGQSSPPAGAQYITGTDGARLKGADGARLLGKAA